MAVLFGLLSAALVWFWLRREIGPTAAANGALLLVVSYLGLRYFRSGEADAVLLFFVSGRHDPRYGILLWPAGRLEACAIRTGAWLGLSQRAGLRRWRSPVADAAGERGLGQAGGADIAFGQVLFQRARWCGAAAGRCIRLVRLDTLEISPGNRTAVFRAGKSMRLFVSGTHQKPVVVSRSRV